jgi:ABC-type antimicrobial peptide transport system permease subunit
MAQYMSSVIDTSALEAASAAQQQALVSAMQAYMQQAMSAYMAQVVSALTTQMQTAMEQMMTQTMSQLTSKMSDAMNIDTDAFAGAFQFNLDEDDLQALILSLFNSSESSFDNNLASFDYALLDKPYEIDIYAKDFEAKGHITDILDAYNEDKEAAGLDAEKITYTDLVGALMSSVTTIIDMISYVLIAFVSISLVVSSIMIGVITYISVLERKKEIGILRAIGASKRNISQVFNAETVIEGLIAGLLGVGITAICCVPASAIVYKLFDVPNIAVLPVQAAVMLVLISVVLTFVAGLIPARNASRKDPVEALRSE